MPIVRVGENIQVEQKLYDKNAGVFIRARLFDDTGAELPESPVSLTHIADGLYRNSDVSMPDNAYITVITAVFYDAGFTVSAEEDYTDGVDIFERVDDLIKTNVVVPRSDEIFVEFDSVDIVVSVDEPEDILVDVDSSEIDVFLDGDGLNVDLDDGNIDVILDC